MWPATEPRSPTPLPPSSAPPRPTACCCRLLPKVSKSTASTAGPDRSAFLSAFFALVGCHGLHVLLGLVWLTTMMAQVWAKGFRDDILRRITCFALFWHALDIIWVALFTSVYLLGTVR